MSRRSSSPSVRFAEPTHHYDTFEDEPRRSSRGSRGSRSGSKRGGAKKDQTMYYVLYGLLGLAAIALIVVIVGLCTNWYGMGEKKGEVAGAQQGQQGAPGSKSGGAPAPAPAPAAKGAAAGQKGAAAPARQKGAAEPLIQPQQPPKRFWAARPSQSTHPRMMWLIILTIIGLMIAGITCAIIFRPTEDRPYHSDTQAQLEANERAIERHGHQVDVTWNT